MERKVVDVGLAMQMIELHASDCNNDLQIYEWENFPAVELIKTIIWQYPYATKIIHDIYEKLNNIS